ncbi:MAG TPA: hypothetical protein VGG33_08975 [Polyangia bacterium]
MTKSICLLVLVLSTACGQFGPSPPDPATTEPERTRQKVIAATRDDAHRAYGDLSVFTVEAAKEGELWRVQYQPKNPSNGGAPAYLVDEKTGALVSKVYTQ